MPIYEYDCPDCGRFEYIQTSSEKPLTTCPNCKEKGKKNKVQRAVSAAAFHLKGSGWYKTDYASKGSSDTGSSKGSKSKKAESPAGCSGSCAASATSAE